MYLESLPDNKFVDPLDVLPKKFYWSGLDLALSGAHEDYRATLQKI